MSLAIICPHCGGTLTWNQSDASVPCPNCSKSVQISTTTEPMALPDEPHVPVRKDDAGGPLDFHGLERNQIRDRVDRLLPEWQRVHVGLSICWFATILLIGTTSLATCCGVSPGQGRDLNRFIPFVFFSFPIVIDLIGRRYCTSIPGAIGQRRAKTAFWFAVGYLGVWWGSVAVRLAELSNSFIIPLFCTVLETATILAAVGYWIRFLHSMGTALRSRELCRKAKSFGLQFGIVIGCVFLAFVGCLVVSGVPENPLQLQRVFALVLGLGALYLLIRHGMLLSFARVTVSRRAQLLEDVLDLDDDGPQDLAEPSTGISPTTDSPLDLD